MKPAVAIVAGLAGPNAAAGGVWEVALSQAMGLKEAGCHVELVAGWLGSNPPGEIRGFPVNLLPVRQLVPGQGLRGLFGIGWPQLLRPIVQNVDIAHVHLCRDYLTMRATHFLATHNVPLIAQTHGMMTSSARRSLRIYDRIAVREILSRVGCYLALTTAERKNLEDLGVPAHRIAMINNAVADPSFRWRDPSKATFLFASRLHARKQPHVFVQAAFELLDTGMEARFKIAGHDQGQAAEIQNLINSSRHAHAFEMLGPLEHPQIAKLLATSTAMVLPSLDEPYPMIVLEAAALGTPLIVTEQIGFKHLLKQSEAAVVITPEPHHLAKAMMQVAADPNLRTQLSCAGRSLYEKHWHQGELAKRLIQIYADPSSYAPDTKRLLRPR